VGRGFFNLRISNANAPSSPTLSVKYREREWSALDVYVHSAREV
jgi:hypothetical protein